MKMKWLASREFSASPGKALATVARVGRVLVTSAGKPRAIMIPTSEATFDSDIELLDRMAMAKVVAEIRADSVRNGTDKLTLEDINAEIAAVRAARRRRP
jgi:hypothetical protein